MRQVPQYLLIGDGRVARHFRHYFSLLQLSFQTWTRQQPLTLLQERLCKASHVLLLVSDNAIDSVAQQCLVLSKQAILLHFSGSLLSEYAYGVHPLMTFNNSLYDLEDYQNIPFIIDDDAPEFSILLPGLTNPQARLPTAFKAKYHALCVLSGNFSCLLWQKFFNEMANLNLPASLIHPYLQRQMRNLLQDYSSALSGPLVRNDQLTLQKNIQALDQDPFQAVYESFVNCYQHLKGEKK